MKHGIKSTTKPSKSSVIKRRHTIKLAKKPIPKLTKRHMMFFLAAAVTCTAVAPMTAFASSSYSMRKKVITAAGIMDSLSDDSTLVTRAQFAKMLVMASPYRSSASEDNTIALFADVARSDENAAYIRIAAEQGWMTGYLGGLFKPDQAVTLQEAARAVLTLLGYTSEDFSGNQAANRVTKMSYLELDEEIGKAATDSLTRFDCVNLFYNLLKTNKKDYEGQTKTGNTVYASVFGYTLTSDGEINPLEALEEKLKGPYAVAGRKLSSIVPFALSKASFYLDGESASKDDLEEEAVVIYYNATTKAVYGYSESGSGGRGATEGTLEAIYYKATDVMIPTSIVVDGIEYALTTSDMQFAFSVYGDLEVGDTITVIWESKADSDSSDSDAEIERTLIDCVD